MIMTEIGLDILDDSVCLKLLPSGNKHDQSTSFEVYDKNLVD